MINKNEIYINNYTFYENHIEIYHKIVNKFYERLKFTQILYFHKKIAYLYRNIKSCILPPLPLKNLTTL